MGKRVDIPKELLSQLLYEEHKSVTAIAKELGVSPHTIRRNMKVHGLVINAEYKKKLLTYDVLYQKYIVENKSIKTLHKELGCGRDFLRERLSNYGLLRAASYNPNEDDRTPLTFELLHTEYIENHLSVSAIASKYHYKPSTVRRHLKSKGIFKGQTSFNGMNISNIKNQKITDNAKFIELVQQGMSVSDLAEIYSCSQDTIYRKKKSLGLENSSYCDVDTDNIIDQYINCEKSCEEISETYNCSSGTIRNRLLESGIELRTSFETNSVVIPAEDLEQYLKDGLSISAIAEIYGCARTTVRNSVINAELQDYLKSTISSEEVKALQMLENMEIEYHLHDRKLLHGKEIDILLDNRIGIEISPCFTHQSDQIIQNSVPKENFYHMSKTLDAEREGIILLTKFDWTPLTVLREYIKYFIRKDSLGHKTIDDFSIRIAKSDRHFSCTFTNPRDKKSDKVTILFEQNKCSWEMFLPDMKNIFCYNKENALSLILEMMRFAISLFKEDLEENSDEIDLLIEVPLELRFDIVCEELGFEKLELIEPRFKFIHKNGSEWCSEREAIEKFALHEDISASELIKYMNNKYYYRVFDCGSALMRYTIRRSSAV